jgi:hypothetical protein
MWLLYARFLLLAALVLMAACYVWTEATSD